MTQDVHQAIAHGLAQELHAPGATLEIEQNPTTNNWRLTTKNDWPKQTAIIIALHPNHITLYDRQHRETQHHYEDPDLLDNLQAALNQIGPP